ncbi:hypothetical protein SAMN05216464_103312 [Mucilaginibacter pineti]|uniref:Uncharacterized protein n=1 Tax=Mucilaginibacter pineti TaxID=1391627 RepID=A0A1G6ZDF1_9SPHI|nr:hypothetical protein [Mucilaginibacter pineti]SDE00679.1 hypothetical protein SAMN05216464_103312 [Mucilaginibacter pineti]
MIEETNKTKYNDTELKEFSELIKDKISIARGELYELTGSLSSANTNGDEAAIAGKTLEDGSATFEKEQTNQISMEERMARRGYSKCI